MKPLKTTHHIGQILVLTAALLAGQIHAANGSWTNEAGGNWSGIANWDPNSVPGTAAGDVVSVTNNIQDTNVTHTISVDTAVTLGTLNLGDSGTTTNISWTLSNGGGSLTFNNSGSGAALNMIATSKGDTISAPMTLADNLTIANSSANTLTLSGAIGGTGGVAVNSSGSGAFSFAFFNAANTFDGPVSILSGNVRLGTINSAGAGGVVTSGPLGKGNDITLANGVGIWGSNTDIAATNLFVLGDVNIGVATNLGTRLRFAGNLNLNGGTRIFRMSRIGTGLSSCTWGFTSIAGMVAVVTNGTISFQAHPNILGTGNSAWVNMNQVAYFTNNSSMIVGQNVVCGGEPTQWLSTNPNSVPNVTVDFGGTVDTANGVNSRSVTVASLAGGGVVVNNATAAGTSTLTILGGGVNALNNTSFTGVIKDGALGKIAVTKQGNSAQTLSGTNTYTGLLRN